MTCLKRKIWEEKNRSVRDGLNVHSFPIQRTSDLSSKLTRLVTHRPSGTETVMTMVEAVAVAVAKARVVAAADHEAVKTPEIWFPIGVTIYRQSVSSASAKFTVISSSQLRTRSVSLTEWRRFRIHDPRVPKVVLDIINCRSNHSTIGIHPKAYRHIRDWARISTSTADYDAFSARK